MAKTAAALKRAEEEEQRTRRAESPSNFNGGRVETTPLAIEMYHRMKQKILNSNHGHPDKSLLFCSPGRGQGNSTVLVNFANTLASDGDRVLLVDANLRDPALHLSFDLEKENGLSDLALDGTRLGDVIKETTVKNLDVITSGASHSDPFSILESPYLAAHIEEMKAHAGWVLFDTPPVSSCSDAIALAGKVGGVVMVVQAEKTRWEAAQDAIERLENAGAKIVGVVLNRRKYRIPRWLYKRL